MSLLARVLDRTPLEQHDGRSGAAIETGHLADGTKVYVKISPLERDLAEVVTGNGRRELELLASGVFDELPDGVGTALVGVEEVDGSIVTVSRAVDDTILGWDRVLSADEVRLVFSRITAVHQRFAGRAPTGLCSLEKRISLFSPQHLVAMEQTNPGLAAAVRRGLELLPELIPRELDESLRRSLADPGPLADALRAQGTTLLHGDFWLVNLALEGSTLVPLDWGIATEGPAAIDLVDFCIGGMSNVALGRQDLLAEARSACGAAPDDAVFALAEYWALMELGWNKALDIVDHDDKAKRDTERADLDFWIRRGLAALEAGLVP